MYKYVVIVRPGEETRLMRFKDPDGKIKAGKKLPEEFQCKPYGRELIVGNILSERTSNILDALGLLGMEFELSQEIFAAGLSAGLAARREPQPL